MHAGLQERARLRHPYPYQEPYLMPKTAPKPQLTAVTALNPWCCAEGGPVVTMKSWSHNLRWLDGFYFPASASAAHVGRSLRRSPSVYRSLCELEHVGALGVFARRRSSGGRTPSGSTSRSNRCRNFSRAGLVRGTSVGGAASGDLGGDLPIDVFGYCMSDHPPAVTQSDCFVSVYGPSARPYMQTRENRRRRQLLKVTTGGAPVSPADLSYLASAGHLTQPLIDPRPAHAGCVHEVGHRCAFLGRGGQRGPQDDLWGVVRPLVAMRRGFAFVAI